MACCTTGAQRALKHQQAIAASTLSWRKPASQGPDAGTCDLTAGFLWDSDDQADDMNLEDACLTLEHWCKL